MKKIISILLSLAILCELLAGCGSVSENSDYITKGEFFALFIEENNLYSDVYSEEDIENSDSYDIEAEIMLEWELIDEDQKSDLDGATTKDLLAQCCVRCMAFRQECSADIKDIKKCHDQQAVIDAVGMGIFELENGYFDALQKMTYEDCKKAIEKTDEVSRNITSDNELEIEYQDDVEDLSDIEIYDITSAEETSETSAETLDSADSSPRITTLAANSNDSMQITTLGSSGESCIEIKIDRLGYTTNRKKLAKGKIVKYDPYNISSDLNLNYTLNSKFGDFSGAFAGEIVSVDEKRDAKYVYIRVAECPIEKIVKDTEGINKFATTSPKDCKPVKSQNAKEGLDIKKTDSGKGVVATFKHTFTLTDSIYGKQKWRNAEAKPSITVTATVDNFTITTKNLGKLILNKDAEKELKVNFDTNIVIDADANGLRYSPANNGNGGFLANLKNSRPTGSLAGGSEEIKLGTANIPLGESGFSITCTFYMFVEMDGSIHVKVSQQNCYSLSVKNKKARVKNASSTPVFTGDAYATIYAGIKIRPSINFFQKSLVDCEAKIGPKLEALASVFSKDNEPKKENVYATKEELDEVASEYSYCIDTKTSLIVEGKLLTTKSVIGNIVINKCNLKAPSISKSFKISSTHFEDGKIMSSCTRLNEGAVEVNDDDAIYLDSYKEHLNIGEEVAVKITSVPINDEKIKRYGGVTLKTGDKNVAVADYNEEKKIITIDAKGEGSTEITIKIKKSKTEKKYYTRKISVTVNASSGTEAENVSYIIFAPPDVKTLSRV